MKNKFYCPNCGFKGVSKKKEKNEKIKEYSDSQKAIKECLDNGAFKDAMGIIEFTQSKTGVIYYFHYLGRHNIILQKIMYCMEQVGIIDLPLLLYIHGLMKKDNKLLKTTINYHEKHNRKCRVYTMFKDVKNES